MSSRVGFFQGINVTVMGLGRFGGGVAVVRFLAEHGANLTLTDTLPAEDLAQSLTQLEDISLHALHLGGHRESDFLTAHVIVANPAVSPENHFLKLAREANVACITEIELFWVYNPSRIIGVTGSNGKSTTATMIHSILQAAGIRSYLGGNIGKSLLPIVEQLTPDDWCVLELSSFQLHSLNSLQVSPDVAVITNFSPNHLDWHGSLDNYRRAKRTILNWQTSKQIAVVNGYDTELKDWPSVERRIEFTEHDEIIDLSDVLLPPGQHNRMNANAAIAATRAIGVPDDAIIAGLQNFTPLPHRLQLVAEVDRRVFYNDSLATTPESAIAALSSFDAPIVLLAGGYDKQIDLGQFADSISQRVKSVGLMGQTAARLDELIDASIPRKICTNFQDAFDWAIAHSATGDVVLLSPGCASYDWFSNFQQRGDQFTKLAQNWQPLSSP